MGKRSSAPWPAGAWRRELADVVTDIEKLLQLLGLEDRSPYATSSALRGFPLRVPRAFINRMRLGDPADPLLRQVLPVAKEDVPVRGFTTDPVGEFSSSPVDSVLHKYQGRALVMVTGACAVHCRYCFRRHFPYPKLGSAPPEWDGAVERIASDPAISEVILSGGDPLTVPDSRLEVLARKLAMMPQLKRLRIHTRLPIVLPQRVDGALTSWIGGLGLQTVVVVHANHANEIDDDVRRALAALVATGVTLLNQAVLLAGVNDSADALADLSEELFGAGVLPYYLHMLDPVSGAAHFEVSDDEAKGLHAELTARLPGYLVPRLVREVPGAPAKIGVDLWS
ncbi:MAG: EF-P beta-lysylation protein EpmB [Acidobacteriota bacterium]|nr:EF-P beta-lysylation protein EpmB [Acidobacteriota bacterium]